MDECSSNSAVCPSNSKCMNTDGSFSCLCLPGYERDDDDDDDDDDDSGGQNVAGCRGRGVEHNPFTPAIANPKLINFPKLQTEK